MNFLEQLVAEWYTLQGYFVRTNIKFGKRSKGGYAGEIDVVAFKPQTGELIHVEPSMDSNPWLERQERFPRKFLPESDLLNLLELSRADVKRVRRIAIVGFSQTGTAGKLGKEIEVKSVEEFVREVSDTLRQRKPNNNAVPEGLPLLRAMQFALGWGKQS